MFLFLFHRFQILEKGPKLLYLNTCIRGYPKGLRSGPDPRKPLISVDEHFEKIEYRSVPSVLFAIEVCTVLYCSQLTNSRRQDENQTEFFFSSKFAFFFFFIAPIQIQFYLFDLMGFFFNLFCFRYTVVVIVKSVTFNWILKNGK